ncbi:MAG TPA: hypothetical protein VGC54_14620 [Planctomycetota bacterium]
MAFRAADYERFTGERTRTPAWWPLWRATFRRGWRSKWVKMFVLGGLGMSLAVTIMLYFVQEVVPEWRETLERLGEQAGGNGPNLVFDSRIYLILLHWFIYPFLMPLSVLLGYDLIAGDLRGNALESYFSRPITPAGYVFGRTLAFTSFLLMATLLPLLWIWCFDVFTAPAGHYQRVKSVPLGLTASLGLTALTLALFVQALTTITRSGIWTALVVVILFVLSGMLGPILYEVTNEPTMLAAAFWENIWVVSNGMLGSPEETARHAPFGLSLSIFLAISGVSLVVLLRRIKRQAVIG